MAIRKFVDRFAIWGYLVDENLKISYSKFVATLHTSQGQSFS